MDSRLRGNDGQMILDLREKLSPLPEKKMKPKHLQHFSQVIEIFPGQQWAFAEVLFNSEAGQ